MLSSIDPRVDCLIDFSVDVALVFTLDFLISTVFVLVYFVHFVVLSTIGLLINSSVSEMITECHIWAPYSILYILYLYNGYNKKAKQIKNR